VRKGSPARIAFPEAPRDDGGVTRRGIAVATTRDARPADAARIAELLDQLGYPTQPQQAAARVARLSADPLARVVAAEVDADVVGVVALRVCHLLEHDRPWCSLIAMVVDERWRRSGIGRRLVDAVEEEARVHGCAGVAIGTAEHREEAHAFYESLGYEHTGRRYKKILS
jgi:GNAT superfamily N-acetyltransferase